VFGSSGDDPARALRESSKRDLKAAKPDRFAYLGIGIETLYYPGFIVAFPADCDNLAENGYVLYTNRPDGQVGEVAVV
jgi:hypothetical protein